MWEMNLARSKPSVARKPKNPDRKINTETDRKYKIDSHYLIKRGTRLVEEGRDGEADITNRFFYPHVHWIDHSVVWMWNVWAALQLKRPYFHESIPKQRKEIKTNEMCNCDDFRLFAELMKSLVLEFAPNFWDLGLDAGKLRETEVVTRKIKAQFVLVLLQDSPNVFLHNI